MVWSLRFQHHPFDDVIEAFFDDVTLANVEDVNRWEGDVRLQLASYGRKVLLLICLDGLVVKPSVTAAFGVARSSVLADHAIASVRYGGDGWTRMSIHTSAVRYHTHGDVFPSRETALTALLAQRPHQRG